MYCLPDSSFLVDKLLVAHRRLNAICASEQVCTNEVEGGVCCSMKQLQNLPAYEKSSGPVYKIKWLIKNHDVKYQPPSVSWNWYVSLYSIMFVFNMEIDLFMFACQCFY